MRLPLFLTLILCTPLLWAQEDSDEAAPAAEEETTTTEAAEESSPPPRREQSPLDYEASEQISEDLSVSFPVDI